MNRPATSQIEQIGNACSRSGLAEPNAGSVHHVDVELQTPIHLELMDGIAAAFPESVVVHLNGRAIDHAVVKIHQNVPRGLIPIPVHVQEGNRFQRVFRPGKVSENIP